VIKISVFHPPFSDVSKFPIVLLTFLVCSAGAFLKTSSFSPRPQRPLDSQNSVIDISILSPLPFLLSFLPSCSAFVAFPPLSHVFFFLFLPPLRCCCFFFDLMNLRGPRNRGPAFSRRERARPICLLISLQRASCFLCWACEIGSCAASSQARPCLQVDSTILETKAFSVFVPGEIHQSLGQL